MGTFEKIRDGILKTGANVFRIALYEAGEWREETLRPVCACLNCYSLSKNFTATAVGIAQDMGLLCIDDPILRFFPNEIPEHRDEKLERVTIKHLLTQTMGSAEGYLFGADRYAQGKDDWVRYALSRPLAFEPGEKFVYSNSTFYLLSCIIHRVSGMAMDMFLREHLFRHMGIDSFAWEACPKGETFGASNLYMSTKDIAKLGVLYLNHGEYEGKRLLSERWTYEAVQGLAGDGGKKYYGYSFWLNDIGYNGGGAYNQIILVVPQRNIVFAAHSYIEPDFDFISIIKSAVG
jgi:CubicO group peptidase (beta-lactamase class C family)